MRFLAYLLSLVMIIMPTYSVWASVASTKGQIVQMGKKGGALIKTSSGVAKKVVAVSKLGNVAGLVYTCYYSKKCRDIVGDIAEIACDSSEICSVKGIKSAITGDDDDDFPDEKCLLYSASAVGGYYYDLNKVLQLGKSHVQQYYSKSLLMSERDVASFKKAAKKAFDEGGGSGYYYIGLYYLDGDRYVYQSSFTAYYAVFKNDVCDPGKQDFGSKKYHEKLSKNELNDLAKKIAEVLDDDDIQRYYNTKYDDIIINNNHYYGDEINRQTNIDNRCQNNSCTEISKEIEKNVINKKYDIDDVNDLNCTKVGNKYIKCKMDGTDSVYEPVKDKDDDPPNKDKGKDKDDGSVFCQSSDMTKKICDFIDWSQDEQTFSDDGKVDVKTLDYPKLDDDRIRFGRSCPAGNTVSVQFAGISIGHQISYQGLCDAFSKMRPFIVGIGTIVSVMIIGGRRV